MIITFVRHQAHSRIYCLNMCMVRYKYKTDAKRKASTGACEYIHEICFRSQIRVCLWLNKTKRFCRSGLRRIYTWSGQHTILSHSFIGFDFKSTNIRYKQICHNDVRKSFILEIPFPCPLAVHSANQSVHTRCAICRIGQ